MSGPRIGSLFSGYGGLDRAVQAVVGGRVVWVCDNDPGAARILAHHHPDAPNLGDITAVDWSAVEPVDVLTLGFPCQDISSAGKQAGIRPGTRSGLWTHAAFAISQLRPRLVVIENVRNLVSAPAHSDVEPCAFCLGDDTAGALRALGAVLGDLADLGFDAEWHGLPASAVGAPHERWREFIAAYPAGQPWSEWDRDGGAAALATDLGHEWAGRAWDGRAWDGRTGPADGGLLPTPMSRDWKGVGPADMDRHDPALSAVGSLLPTPRATDGDKGGPNQRGSSGDLMLPSAVLLPTPMANEGQKAGQVGRTDGGQEYLTHVVHALLPTPTVEDSAASGGGYNGQVTLTDATVRQLDRWGKYVVAIERWEVVTRCAPAPTQLSSKGTPQLAPVFSEWMMGLPLGHVTDPAIWDGMTDKRGKPASASAKRNAQLRAIGNGVLPLQASTALRVCLERAAA